MKYFGVTNCTSLDFCLQKTCNLSLQLKFFNLAVHNVIVLKTKLLVALGKR